MKKDMTEAKPKVGSFDAARLANASPYILGFLLQATTISFFR